MLLFRKLNICDLLIFREDEDKDYNTMCQFYKNKASGIGNASSSFMSQNLGQFT